MRKLIYVLSLLMVIAMGCTKDFVETNLEGKKVFLHTPSDGATSSQFSQTFWWEKLDGASKYRLQIVRATFSNPQELMLDTAVASNKYSFSLSPGAFQWRVRAENSSSYSDYATRSLAIDSTFDLGKQQVILIAPVNGDTTNKGTITFQWNKLLNAINYNLRVTNSFNVPFDTLITGNTLTRTFPEGTYTWFVRADNSTSTSKISEIRSLVIDKTAPVVSVPVFPANGDSINLGDSITWTRSASTVADSIFIYTDINLTNLQKKDSSPTTMYFITGIPASKDYWWVLRSLDGLGNTSGNSQKRKFRVK